MTIKGDKRVALDGTKFFAEGEVYIAEATKILGAEGKVGILSKEVFQSEVRIRYRAQMSVIYAGKEGIGSAEAESEGTVGIRGAEIELGDEVWVNLVVVNTEYVGLNNVKLRMEVEGKGFVYKKVAFETCTPTEGILVRDETATTEHVIPIPQTEVVLGGKHTVKENVDKIITANSNIVVNKVSTAT